MSTCLLSVVIPVYNAVNYLSACLDSFISAGISEAEILLIDDGSSDGSIEKASEYADKYPNIRLITQKNSGPSAARNRGIREASGEYIIFADADDYIIPQNFSHRLELINCYDADVWFSDFYRVDDSGRILDRIHQIEPTPKPMIGRDYIESYLTDSECVWNVWRSIYRKSFLLENGLFFREDARIAEDLEFSVRVLCKSQKPAFYHEPYYNYRVNYGTSLTRVYTAERVEQFVKMISLSFDTLEEEKPDFSQQLKNKLLREYIFNMAVCCEVPKAERKTALICYRDSKKLLVKGNSKLCRVAVLSIRAVGILSTSKMLLTMKKLKRSARLFAISQNRRTLK